MNIDEQLTEDVSIAHDDGVSTDAQQSDASDFSSLLESVNDPNQHYPVYDFSNSHNIILSETLKYFFDEQEYHYDFDEESNKFALRFTIDSKLTRVSIFVQAFDDGIKFLYVSPIDADDSVKNAIAEYLFRANYGIRCGAFQFDHDDGEILFKAFLYSPNTIPSFEQLDFYFNSGLHAFARYGNGLMKCLLGIGTPKENIEE